MYINVEYVGAIFIDKTKKLPLNGGKKISMKNCGKPNKRSKGKLYGKGNGSQFGIVNPSKVLVKALKNRVS